MSHPPSPSSQLLQFTDTIFVSQLLRLTTVKTAHTNDAPAGSLAADTPLSPKVTEPRNTPQGRGEETAASPAAAIPLAKREACFLKTDSSKL